MDRDELIAALTKVAEAVREDTGEVGVCVLTIDEEGDLATGYAGLPAMLLENMLCAAITWNRIRCGASI